MKIEVKIAIVFVIFGLFLITACYLSVYITESYLTNSIGERFSLMSDILLHQIEESVDSYYNNIIFYTSDEMILSGLRKSNEEFSKMNDREAYIDTQDALWQNTSKNEITPFINATIENEVADKLRNIIYSTKNGGDEIFSEIFITNAYGVNIFASGKTSDYRQNDELWWQEAREFGKYIDDLEYDESSGVYSITVAARIDDSDGNFLGVVKVVVRFRELTKRITEIENNKYFDNETSEVKIFTTGGKTIYSTGYDYTLLENVSQQNALTTIISADNYSNKYFVYTEENDTPELFGCSISSELKWILCIDKPTKNILSKVTQLRNLMLTIFIAISLIMICAGIFIVRAIIQPIEKLTITASEIGKGNLDIQTNIHRNDELGKLAESIDKMVVDLKKLDQVKMDFLNVVSHELKTPLTVIYAYLDILDSYKSKFNKDVVKDLEVIKRNSKQLHQLITNILEMARIDAGKFELVLVPVNVSKNIKEVIHNMQPLAKNNKNVLTAKIKNVPEAVVTDEQRFEEILNNLVSNAIKFTENGKITIEASSDEKNLIVSVKDTGVGMPEEKMKNLFTKFYQVDSTISRHYGGTGLGLSITKQLVEMQSGKIWVESREKYGTTFYFTLPLYPKKMIIENGDKMADKVDKIDNITSVEGEKQ